MREPGATMRAVISTSVRPSDDAVRPNQSGACSRSARGANSMATLANGDAFFIRLTGPATWEQPAP